MFGIKNFLLIAFFSLQYFSFSQQEPEFVHVENGHLYRGKKRLTLWGINIHGPTATSMDYSRIDSNVQRLKALGFNAVRLWGGGAFCDVKDGKRVYYNYVKGDRSPLDFMDYSISKLKENGFTIWLTWFDYAVVTPEDVDLVKDPKTSQQWIEAVKQLKKPEYSNGRALIFYFDERAKQVFKDHISKVLNHVNQYTGLAIKDDPVFGIYEIANELQFIDRMLGFKGKLGFGHSSVEEILPPFFLNELREKWNKFLREKYGSDKGILKAWGKLDSGESVEDDTVKLQPTYQTASQYPEQRGRDIVEFYHNLYVGTCKELVEHIRKQGSPGKGCSVIPIIFHTISWHHGVHMAYNNFFGDVIAYGGYWAQQADKASLKKKLPLRYPWYTFIETKLDMSLGPGGFLHPYKIVGKPTLLYEINCYRSDKFRAEFPILHAICGSWSDLDGIFFYTWDYGFNYNEQTLPNEILRYPTPDHYWHGVVFYTDEIFLSQIFTAGLLFKNRILKPPDKPTIIHYGKDYLFNINQKWYGILHEICPTMLVNGLQIRFDPNLPETKIDGPIVKEIKKFWKIDEVLHWDEEKGFLKLDLPSAKVAAGFLPPNLEFKDGVQLKGICKLWLDPDDLEPPQEGEPGKYKPYYVFSMVSEDGQELEKTNRIWISLVSTSHNAGFVFDPSRIETPHGDGIPKAILSYGTKPVQVNRVGATIIIPFAKNWNYRKLDFSMKSFEQGIVKEKIAIVPTDPLFLLVIEKP